MGGLLYKDFTSISGRRLSSILILLTAGFMILRVIYQGSSILTPDLMAIDEAGNSVSMIDFFFILACELLLVSLNGMINSMVSKICISDEKNKIRGYLFACPLKKSSYIASKYVFIIIMTYAFISIYMIWSIVCMAFLLPGGRNEDSLSLLNTIAVPFFCLSLLNAAIELPAFLLLGRDRAMMIKIGIWMFIAMLLIGYLLFGDLDVFENLDLAKILAWANAHQFELLLTNTLFPVMTALLYYGSYRLTAALYERKEHNYD